MPPDQPDELSGPSKRHRRSRSFSMMDPSEVIDVSDSSESGASGSRKHDRHEKDPQAEGPNKRHKHNRRSEPPMPPMRKDTTITPKAKQKKSRKKVDHHKAPRTSNFHLLKERITDVELELANARQAHDDENREHQANLDWHAKELELLQKRYHEQADEVLEKVRIIETERRENQTLKQNLRDTANDVVALQLSCQNKDMELKGKQAVIAIKQKELDDGKHRSTSFEKSLAEAKLALDGKDELIATKQEELDDSKQQSLVLEECLAEKILTVKRKDAVITDLQQKLDGSSRQCASFEKSLAAMELELKAKDEVINANQKELEESRQTYSTLEKSFGEKTRALTAAKRDQSDCRTELALRDEKLSSTELELDQTKVALEKALNENESLHVINEGNGHRNHNIRSREKKAKDALKSLEIEHKDKASEFEAEKAELQCQCLELQENLEAKENEKNHMITKLQLKLKTARQQSQRYNYKEPDEKIKKDFVNLESKIRQFVDNCARPVLNATNQELGAVWPDWSPELRNFLASPLLCNQVLEAYVWECLVTRIFSAGSNVWVGDLGRSMEKALFVAADETAQAGFNSELYVDFQYLRSSSSSLVGRLNGADFRPKYFDADVKTMISTLAKLCRLDEIDDSMEADAMDIFKDARDFEIQLRMLKAAYTIRMYKLLPGKLRLKYGFPFADEDMDVRFPKHSGKTPEQVPLVDFIMCPGLYKRGNNSGANYETRTCLIKMGVVCNASELCRKFVSSNSAQLSSTQAQNALCSGEVKQQNGGSASRTHPNSTTTKAKKGSSLSNPVHIKGEETDKQHTTGLTFGSAAPGSAQMQPGMRTCVKTRSQTYNNVRDGNSSTKSTNSHSSPMAAANGRGAGSSGKTNRHSKGTDPDADYTPSSNL